MSKSTNVKKNGVLVRLDSKGSLQTISTKRLLEKKAVKDQLKSLEKIRLTHP